MKRKISIHLHTTEEPIPYELLLLADPSREFINRYITSGRLYLAKYNNEIIGCYILCSLESNIVEIKNIAVNEAFQNKGVGYIMLKDAILKAREANCKKLIIGTGNSSIGQLYLYQKIGFKITGIKKNFFKDHYPDPIRENGIECTDMILLAMDL